jgi:hypothetical protein
MQVLPTSACPFCTGGMWCGWKEQATLAHHSDCFRGYNKNLRQELLLGYIDKATT